MPDNKDYSCWKDNNEQGKNIWKGGYQPSDILTNVGSGGTDYGHLANVLSYDKGTPVTKTAFALRDVELYSIPAASLTNVWLVNVFVQPEVDTSKEEVLTTSEKLDKIREIFGLSISHLSSILRVSRPSVHSWLDGKEPRDQALERIDGIYHFALDWKELSPFHYSPGRLIRQRLGNSVSMLELFESEVLDETKIKAGFSKLVELMSRQRSKIDKANEMSGKSNLSQDDKDKMRHSLTRTIESPEK